MTEQHLLYLIDGVSKGFSRIILTMRCNWPFPSLFPKTVNHVAQCLTYRKYLQPGTPPPTTHMCSLTEAANENQKNCVCNQTWIVCCAVSSLSSYSVHSLEGPSWFSEFNSWLTHFPNLYLWSRLLTTLTPIPRPAIFFFFSRPAIVEHVLDGSTELFQHLKNMS